MFPDVCVNPKQVVFACIIDAQCLEFKVKITSRHFGAIVFSAYLCSFNRCRTFYWQLLDTVMSLDILMSSSAGQRHYHYNFHFKFTNLSQCSFQLQIKYSKSFANHFSHSHKFSCICEWNTFTIEPWISEAQGQHNKTKNEALKGFCINVLTWKN